MHNMDKNSMLNLADDLGKSAKNTLEKGETLVNSAGIGKNEPINMDYITKGVDLLKMANESARTAIQMHKYGTDKVYR